MKTIPIKYTIDRLKNFKRNPDYEYLNDYEEVYRKVRSPNHDTKTVLRTLTAYDNFFFGFFILGVDPMHHPWVLERCLEVTHDIQSETLDLWAREHFKSMLFSRIEIIQRMLRSPWSPDKKHPMDMDYYVENLKPKLQYATDERIGIFSFNSDLASKFLIAIKKTYETFSILPQLFPDLLYENPKKEADKWTEQALNIKQLGVYREESLSAWGLVDAMPTGYHLTGRVYDDVVTMDNVKTEYSNEKVMKAFEMSKYLGMRATPMYTPWHRIVGTIYRHDDPYTKMMQQKRSDGTPLFKVRIHPATEKGEWYGAPVLMSEREIDEKRSDAYAYSTQYLLNPQVGDKQQIKGEYLVVLPKEDIPKPNKLYYFMIVDPAGDKASKTSKSDDNWALLMCGVEPYIDEIGFSNVYITDAVIKEMTLQEAQREIYKMYIKQKFVRKLGIERTGVSLIDVHVSNYLKNKNRFVNLKNKRLEILKPASRNKQFRIEAAIAAPLNNACIHISDAVPVEYIKQLKMEMDKFPTWKDDGIDALSYLYDLIATFKFPMKPSDNDDTVKERPKRKRYQRRVRGGFLEKESKRDWLTV